MPPENDCQCVNLERLPRSVAESFDQAAANYDQCAELQRRAGESLARCIIETAPCRVPRHILEIGCGTGFLTESLLPFYHEADWTITDISPRMVDLCRLKIRDLEYPKQQDPLAIEKPLRQGQRNFQVMDARTMTIDGQFDLICSNFVFQWFLELRHIIIAAAGRLTPGGAIVFNTLGADSFSYWRTLDTLIGGEPSAPVFPSVATLVNELLAACSACFDNDLEIETRTENMVERHPSFLDFLRHLNTIGAGTPIGNRPGGFARLRNVIRRSRDSDTEGHLQGVPINYQVVTVILRRPA